MAHSGPISVSTVEAVTVAAIDLFEVCQEPSAEYRQSIQQRTVPMDQLNNCAFSASNHFFRYTSSQSDEIFQVVDEYIGSPKNITNQHIGLNMDWQVYLILGIGVLVIIYGIYTVYNLSNFLGDYLRR